MASRKKHRKPSRRTAMKACAKRNKVTSRKFHACVRRKVGAKK